MKIVQIMPAVYGKPSLKTLLKNTERSLRGKGTTFIRQKEGRWVHARYAGWINWADVRGTMLLAEVRSRKPQEEWQLLNAFIGYLDRHMSKFIRHIGITYCDNNDGVPPAVKAQSKSKRLKSHLEKRGLTISQYKSSSRKITEHIKKKLKVKVNKPRQLPFKGERYVFTGRFDYGVQRECEDATRKRGAAICQNVSADTTVLVVGVHGNPSYRWKKYGLKIAKAEKLRQKSRDNRPLIVTEYTWSSNL